MEAHIHTFIHSFTIQGTTGSRQPQAAAWPSLPSVESEEESEEESGASGPEHWIHLALTCSWSGRLLVTGFWHRWGARFKLVLAKRRLRVKKVPDADTITLRGFSQTSPSGEDDRWKEEKNTNHTSIKLKRYLDYRTFSNKQRKLNRRNYIDEQIHSEVGGFQIWGYMPLYNCGKLETFLTFLLQIYHQIKYFSFYCTFKGVSVFLGIAFALVSSQASAKLLTVKRDSGVWFWVQKKYKVLADI